MTQYGKIDGRDTVRQTSSEIISMPGTKGGVRAKLTKTKDVEYVLPKEKSNRPDYTVKDTQNARIDKKAFDANFDKIDWSK